MDIQESRFVGRRTVSKRYLHKKTSTNNPWNRTVVRERSVDPAKLKGSSTVIKFRFPDLREQVHWWLIVENGSAEVCISDPGKDVDVYFNCSVRVLSEVWMGERTYRDAIQSGDLSVQGDRALTRNVTSWLRRSVFADSARAMPALAAGDR